MTVHYTLRAVSAYPLVVLATDTLPQSSRDLINDAGMDIIDVPHLAPAAGQHAGFDPSFARFNDAWTKLAVFGLEQFERVILIDADMIFLRGMDELFDLELKDGWIGAAPACVCTPFKIADYPTDWYVDTIQDSATIICSSCARPTWQGKKRRGANLSGSQQTALCPSKTPIPPSPRPLYRHTKRPAPHTF